MLTSVKRKGLTVEEVFSDIFEGCKESETIMLRSIIIDVRGEVCLVKTVSQLEIKYFISASFYSQKER